MSKHILISRTDGIGDVILTLPMAKHIKDAFPEVKVSFLGRSYTQAVIEGCLFVDTYLNWDELEKLPSEQAVKRLQELQIDTVLHVFPRKEVVELAKNAKIGTRVATARRWHTFSRVNKPLWYSRKKSNLHESQLNLKMLSALGIRPDLSLEAIADSYGLSAPEVELPPLEFLDAETKIILHPMSHGSALEWPLEKYAELAGKLVDEGIAVAISGTQKERDRMEPYFEWDRFTDLGGKLSLPQLIAVIGKADVLVAASTGPLHIAAALQKFALGLYTPKRPLHPGRWMPVGKQAEHIVAEIHPEDGKLPIEVDQVLGRILEWKAKR